MFCNRQYMMQKFKCLHIWHKFACYLSHDSVYNQWTGISGHTLQLFVDSIWFLGHDFDINLYLYNNLVSPARLHSLNGRLLHSPKATDSLFTWPFTAGKLSTVRAVQGDCKRVYGGGDDPRHKGEACTYIDPSLPIMAVKAEPAESQQY